jgi:hypothetical protein
VASDGLFHIRVFSFRLFGLNFVAKELVVRADEEQVVGVGVDVDEWVVRPARIPIVFPLPLLVCRTLAMERGALNARKAAMELGIEFMKVRVFDEIAVNLHDTIRPHTSDGIEDLFWDIGFWVSFGRHRGNRKFFPGAALLNRQPQFLHLSLR